MLAVEGIVEVRICLRAWSMTRRIRLGQRRLAVVLAGIVALAIVATLPVALSAAPLNLLTNAGFELDANNDGKPDSWSSKPDFTRSSGGENSAYAGRWSSTADSGSSSYQQVNVTAGTTYTFSGWVNAPATADAFTFRLKILWRNAAGAISVALIRKFTDDTGGIWQTVTGSAVAPAGATIARVQMVTGSLNGTIYVDNLSFGPAGAASSSPQPTPTPTPPSGSQTVLVGAADIANCNTTTDEATAKLLDAIAGTVFTAGDNAYSDGTQANFDECYVPTWGRHKARTRPAPGNHDYHVSGATGYFGYWGALAGPSGLGYYAYTIGSWRVYSLNSEVVSTEQVDWLRADLAANPRACIVAYWHHPRLATPYANGTHGPEAAVEPLWDALADAGADLVINGHNHHYERFAPNRGITEVIVGTGGTPLVGFASTIASGSIVRQSTAHGVLRVNLGESGFQADFLPIEGQSFTDSFGAQC